MTPHDSLTDYTAKVMTGYKSLMKTLKNEKSEEQDLTHLTWI